MSEATVDDTFDRNNPMRSSPGRRVWLAATVVALLSVGGGVAVATSSTRSGVTGVTVTTGSSSTQRALTFISLVPACACGSHTVLSAFSMEDGRLVHNLGVLENSDQANVSTPTAENDGQLVITVTTDERCALSGTFSECPQYTPNSCTNRVEAVGPETGEDRTLFTVAGARSIGVAVPSPDGSEFAFAQSPCAASPGTTGVYVRAGTTGRTRVIASTHNPCDSLGQQSVSWNAAGTQIVFPYDTSTASPTFGGLGNECSGEFHDRLAIAPVRRVGAQPTLKFISPDRGCAFVSAAYDTGGIAAAEGCSKGSPAGFNATNLGNAYLIQLNRRHHITRRYALKRGLEEGLVASVPHTGDVLVTQDQPANNGAPPQDWVWDLQGHRLRSVAHYRAEDAAQIIAVPW